VQLIDRYATDEVIDGIDAMPDKTTGEEIFRVTSEYLEQGGLQWLSCVSVFTHGAAAMVGHIKGFMSRVRENNPNPL
jgi:hypothetical protein